jgi:arylsulfatase A-like enzyme
MALMRGKSNFAAWFVAGPLLWAGIDLVQVGASIGGQPLGRLPLVVLPFYLVGGAILWGLWRIVVARSGPPSEPATALVTSTVLPGFLLAVAYVNFVHLPDFRSALTIIANAALLIVGAVVCVLVKRTPGIARLAASRTAVALVACAGLALTSLAARGWSSRPATVPTVSADDRPSIFIVVIDSLRADRVGRPRPPAGDSLTPTLDALARRGVAFEHAYAHASWTKPSVASLLTSLHPPSHQANLRRDRLSPDAPTLAESFAEVGYRTAVFSANPWISPAFGFDRGVMHFVETERETFGRLVLLLRVLRAVDRQFSERPMSRGIAAFERGVGLGHDRRNNCQRDDAILRALDSWLADTSPSPVFAYLHLMSPHIPYDPPSGTRGFDSQTQVDLLMRTRPLEPERYRVLVDLYDATVRYSDSVLRGFLDTLDRHGIGERSILVVTADHGEEFFEHGRFGHGKTLYEEVIRVPLILVGPGVASHADRRTVVSHVDVAPTLARLTGITPARLWVGEDLLRPATEDPIAFSELLREGGLEVAMVSDGRRKYIETVDRLGTAPRAELFDLRLDPGEQAPRPPGDAEPLRDELARRKAAARTRALTPEATSIDPGQEERLRALGYLN